MREKFTGHYGPSSEELQSLWNSATIVFDANVLSDFHRFQERLHFVDSEGRVDQLQHERGLGGRAARDSDSGR